MKRTAFWTKSSPLSRVPHWKEDVFSVHGRFAADDPVDIHEQLLDMDHIDRGHQSVFRLLGVLHHRHLPVSFGGLNVYMVHDRKNLPEELCEADVVLFGHSDKYSEQPINGRLRLNPGSCGRRRFKLEVSIAILSAYRDSSTVQRITLDSLQISSGGTNAIWCRLGG